MRHGPGDAAIARLAMAMPGAVLMFGDIGKEPSWPRRLTIIVATIVAVAADSSRGEDSFRAMADMLRTGLPRRWFFRSGRAAVRTAAAAMRLEGVYRGISGRSGHWEKPVQVGSVHGGSNMQKYVE